MAWLSFSPNFVSVQGFKRHVEDDHNMWAYIFFFIHLSKKSETDMTATELYIHEKVGSLVCNVECARKTPP